MVPRRQAGKSATNLPDPSLLFGVLEAKPQAALILDASSVVEPAILQTWASDWARPKEKAADLLPQLRDSLYALYPVEETSRGHSLSPLPSTGSFAMWGL